MIVQDKGLQLEFEVKTPVVLHADELVVKVTLINVSAAPMRLYLSFLQFPQILLEVRNNEGKPVPLAPPPVPPDLSDPNTRLSLAKGETLPYVYQGRSFFGGNPLADGEYQIRFRLDHSFATAEEWNGVLESNWLPFKLRSEGAIR